jgi:3-(3-hydroxy-phenyl)propionate hydroxylase
VIFCGDSAHVVSPFGARGGNGGLQDVDALGWRLAHVAQGGDVGVLAAYDRERTHGADENLLNSSRTTRFMSPADGAERVFRDAVLALAGKAAFARPLVNSGRLSRPCVYPLAGADDPALPFEARPGAVAPDAPLPGGWLIDRLGREVVVLAIGQPAPTVSGVKLVELGVTPEVQVRYLGAASQAVYLIRPDQIVAARWVSATPAVISAAADAIWRDA